MNFTLKCSPQLGDKAKFVSIQTSRACKMLLHSFVNVLIEQFKNVFNCCLCCESFMVKWSRIKTKSLLDDITPPTSLCFLVSIGKNIMSNRFEIELLLSDEVFSVI